MLADFICDVTKYQHRANPVLVVEFHQLRLDHTFLIEAIST